MAVLVVTALALAHALIFVGYIVDDAFISFRYARNVAQGLGLVYNAGEPVEGYTNFLWVVLAALGFVLQVKPSLLMPAVGLGCHLSLIWAVLRYGHQLAQRENTTRVWSGVPATLIVGASTGAAFYAVTGLETPCYSLLVTLGAMAVVQGRPRAFALWTAMAFLTRPEAAITGIAGTALLGFRAFKSEPGSEQRSGLPWALGIFSVALVPYLAFKWAYFGTLFPNTLFAKTPNLGSGLLYAGKACLPAAGIILVAVLPLRSGQMTPERRWLLLLWAAQVLGVVAEGGDWMPANRFFVPYMPLLALAVDGHLVRAIGRESGQHWARRAFCLISVFVYAVVQIPDSMSLSTRAQNTMALDENRAAVALRLSRQGVKRVAAHDIGLMGYLLPDVRVIDLGGLVDPHIAKSPGGYGTKQPGFDYLERMAPDRILIATGPPVSDKESKHTIVIPLFEVEQYLRKSAWFKANYRHAESHALSSTYHLHVFARISNTDG